MSTRPAIFAGLLLAVATLSSTASFGQQPGAANQGRDCQTVRTCNFSRTGAVRGCLSSYTCRTCRTVAVACTITGVPGRCQELRCGWGA